MSKREYYLRYHLIIKRLQRAPATFEEMQSYLERESVVQGFEFRISLRTFQRDLNEIRTLFNTDIRYDKKLGSYSIIQNEENDVSNHLLEAFDMFNVLKMSSDITRHIFFEKRKPQGTEHFYGLLQAIKTRRCLILNYCKFWEEKPAKRLVEPYALKESKSRWYLIAKDANDNRIKTFGLDRIENFEIMTQKFQLNTTFNPDELFKNCFGVINISGEPQTVVLSFTPEQGKYIKTFRLHETQKTISDNEDEYRIELKILITLDFIMELLSYGDEVEVIAPKKLRNEVTTKLRAALKQYV